MEVSQLNHGSAHEATVVAEALQDVAFVGQAVGSIERSSDGLHVTICMNAGQRYGYGFKSPDEGLAFYTKMVDFLRDISIQNVMAVTVQAPPANTEGQDVAPNSPVGVHTIIKL